MDYLFDSGGATLEDLSRICADLWSDLAFDGEALAQLKRDGLLLDGVRLTGTCPFLLTAEADGQIRVSVMEDAPAEPLMDLWRVYFMKALRPRSLAA